MTKKSESLWDDGDPTAWDFASDTYVNEETAKKQPRARKKKHKSWWEEYDDYVIGGRQSEAPATTGDKKVAGFDYRSAFDDEDEHWYRQNSFRYSRTTDYSPSRQFRSFYSSSSSYSYSSYGLSATSDELANKCLNALRALTRNANTIVDQKDQATYLVQFKNGVESLNVAKNNAEAGATKKDTKLLYVSPTDLAKAKDADAEDRAIDELTGFVLLRVQLQEGNKEKILDAINDTGLHTVAGMLATKLVGGSDKIDPTDVANSVTHLYLAGLISKALLARIARKQVVANWGGFGPYFARHASKFSIVKEELQKETPNNVENVVQRIVYNLLNDESPLPLGESPEAAKAIEDIVSKYFEAEVPAENMLAQSKEAVEEINKYFTKDKPDALGPMAAGLKSALEDLKEKMGAAEREWDEVKENLMPIAKGLNEATTGMRHGSFGVSKADQPMNEKIKQMNKLQHDLAQHINSMKHLEHALSNAKHDKFRMDSAAAKIIEKALGEKVPDRASMTEEEFKEKTEALKKKLEEKIEESLAQYKKLAEALRKEYDEVAESVKKLIEEEKTRATEIARNVKKELADEKALEKLSGPQINMMQAVARHMAERAKQLRMLATSVETDKKNVGDQINSVDRLKEANDGAIYDMARTESRVQSYISRIDSILYSAVHQSPQAGSEDQDLSMACLANEIISHTAHKSEHGTTPLTERELENITRNVITRAGRRKETQLNMLHSLIEQLTKVDLSELQNKYGGVENHKELLEQLGISQALASKLSGHKNETAAKPLKSVIEAIKKALQTAKDKSAVDNDLFTPMEVAGFEQEKAAGIDTAALSAVNKEADRAQEEEHVAFLKLNHGNDSRPKMRLVKPTPTSYTRGAQVTSKVIQQNQGAIRNIQNALMFQAGKRSVEEFGLRSGDLDDGGLHKLSYDSENIWSKKTLTRLPDVAVGLLIDQSGSMSGPKIVAARDLCISMAEALKRIAGVRLYIYGHTANQQGQTDMAIFEHYHPDHGGKTTNLGLIQAYSNNYDGFALKEAARFVSKDPAKRKYMFVIADGFPSGTGYGGDPAQKHVASVVKFLKDRWHIQTYAFGVGIDSEGDFCEQYGRDHTVFVRNVTACQGKIVRFLRNVLQRETSLIGVAD